MEQQEYFMKMQMLGQEAERIEQQIQMIEQQVAEMSAVRESVEIIKEGKNKEVLANLGKGIFVRADLREKDLLVNVGKEVIVKKTPDETIKVIDDQIKRLIMGKQQFIERINELQNDMQKMLLQMQKEHSQSGEHSHKCENEDCECEEPCEDCSCEHEHKEEKKKNKKK